MLRWSKRHARHLASEFLASRSRYREEKDVGKGKGDVGLLRNDIGWIEGDVRMRKKMSAWWEMTLVVVHLVQAESHGTGIVKQGTFKQDKRFGSYQNRRKTSAVNRSKCHRRSLGTTILNATAARGGT